MFWALFLFILACMFFGMGQMFKILFTLISAFFMTVIVIWVFWLGMLLLFA